MWGGAGSDLVPPLFRPRGATFPWGKVGGRLVAALRCFPFIRVFCGNVGCFLSSVWAFGPDTFPGGEIGADALAFYRSPAEYFRGPLHTRPGLRPVHPRKAQRALLCLVGWSDIHKNSPEALA